MTTRIVEDVFDPWAELSAHEKIIQASKGKSTKIGAVATFVGAMRDFNEGDMVKQMRLEHYPEMAEQELDRLEIMVREQWSLQDVLVIHRVGEIMPSEPIVLVAVWSSHRKDAFGACRQFMEELKSSAPFWKQETLADNSRRWVENNTPGY